MRRPTVLLADDHVLVLEGFRRILEEQFDLVGMVEDGRALVKAAGKLQPDVILLDISMPLLNGIEAARQIKHNQPKAKLIFVTMHGDPAYVTEALRVGASGYLLKRSPPAEMIQAIRDALLGRVFVTSLVLSDTLAGLLAASKRSKKSSDVLTMRQREVLQLIAEGHSNKAIAEILSVSGKTVEFHKAKLKKRLGLRTQAELTRFALKHHIVEA